MKQLLLNKLKSITPDQVMQFIYIALAVFIVVGCILVVTGHLTVENGEIKIVNPF